MSEPPNKSNPLTDSENRENENSKCRQYPFPPKLSRFQKIVLIATYVLAFVVVINLIDKCCIHYRDPCVCCIYINLALLLAFFLVDRTIRYKMTVHKARLVDHSLVEATMVEVRTVWPRLIKPSKRPDPYDDKVKELNDEVERLKDLGNLGWTEYQVLSLNQLLVDFYAVEDLIANTRLNLEELEEYAEDSTIRYDREKYYDLKKHIDVAMEKIEEEMDKTENTDEEKRDDAAKLLRAELSTLLERVADHKQNWTMGSKLLGALWLFGTVSVAILLLMGLLPILHPGIEEKYLSIFNWGMFGICGAISAVLLNLRKSNIVEVGNTEGKKELRNAILGAALGLVAGILAYSMFKGGLFQSGIIVPDLETPEMADVYLSIIWGIASGFSFEKIFDRMRSTTVGEN